MRRYAVLRWMSGQVRACPDIEPRRLAWMCSNAFDLQGPAREKAAAYLIGTAQEVLFRFAAAPGRGTAVRVERAIQEPTDANIKDAVRAVIAARDVAGAVNLYSKVADTPFGPIEKLVLSSNSPQWAYVWAKMVRKKTERLEDLRAIARRSPYYGMMFDMEFG